MNRTILIAAATAVALIITPLSAISADKSKNAAFQKEFFKTLDANNDGKVTEKDFVIFVLYQVFHAFDTDNNERLTQAEFLKGSAKTPEGKNAAAEWAMMDTDGNGVITFKDSLKNKNAIDEMRTEFKKLDKTGKGYVTLQDVMLEEAR